MKAQLLLNQRHQLADDAFMELVIWRVPTPVRGSKHNYKYRFALVENDVCTLRYDNEAGKGDHRHADGQEFAYGFVDMDTLIVDFRVEVGARRQK
jgi:hypothetical protein